MSAENGGEKGGISAKRRYGRSRQIADHLKPVTRTIFGKRGFADGDMINDWTSVIGPELARFTAPERIAYPRGKRAGGTLHLRIASGSIAVELQHLLPLLIERINGHFGYRAVEHVHFIQAPIPAAKKAEEAPAELPEDVRAEVAALVADVEDDDLRQSLERLGQSILRRASGNQPK